MSARRVVTGSGRVGRFCLAAVLVTAACDTAGAAQAPDDAAEAFRSGEYAQAISAYRSLVRSDAAPPGHHIGLVRALMAVGRYEDAEDAARDGVGRHGAELQGTLGRALDRQGKTHAAEAAFTAAIEGGATDANVARLDRALLDFRRGRHDEAMAEFDAFIDLYNDGLARSSEDLTAVATAVRHLGADDPDLFRDALRAYDEAVAADPWNHEARILTGELFLEKYNGPDAGAAFRDVLTVNPSHPDALVGLARLLRFDGESGVREALEQALQVNPGHVPGRVFLASLHLSAERYDQAQEEAERALEVNPASLEARSVLAAAHYLSGDTPRFEDVRRETFELNPRYAELLNTVADLAVDQRRYAQAVELAREAVSMDPQSWRGLGILGINLLRLGRVDESREALEKAFAGDPFNVWYKNTLDLLDTYDRYVTVETEHFAIFMRDDEADLLEPYATSVAEEAYARLVERYGYEPPTPVRLELYPSHADFSVRTAGLAGIGILGVSFGSVLAMDSPSARGIGEFNWGSTLWHELAHAFHLGMTEHRVPRWFSEGLAVREQRLARVGWGHQPDVAFLRAYDEGRLHPVSTLNDGFVRPSYPQQVVFSYYQASLVFEMIEAESGFEAVLAMLRGYRDGRQTEALVAEVLGMSMDALDERFDAFMQQRFGETLSAVRPRDLGPDPSRERLERHLADDPTDFTAHMILARLLVGEGAPEAAIPHLEAARELFPALGAPDGPSWQLGNIREELGDLDRAADEFRQAALRNEGHYAAGLEEARLRRELGDLDGAVEALDRAILVHPYEIEVHEDLAGMLAETGQWERAVRERKAVVALDPTDRAAALYQLARAHHMAGHTDEARRQVLEALEVAPSYDEALELLLEIRAGAGPRGKS